MPEHTITVEITVTADSRCAAYQHVSKELDWTDLGWQLAIHERPDLPSTVSTYTLATAAQV